MLARSWKQHFFGYIHFWKRILSSYGYHNKSMDVWENLETSVLKVSQIFVNVFIILWKPWEIYHLIIVSVVNNNNYIVPLQYIFIHNL